MHPRQAAGGIEHVNGSIKQMGQVSQQNAALVEPASVAAESMQQRAATPAGAARVSKFERARPVPRAIARA